MQEEPLTQAQRDQSVQDLTCGIASGSESHFRQFYDLYFDPLYRHLLHLTSGDENLTRDLVQTVLLRVIRYIKVFPNERVLWAWLRQVCRSCHIDWLRRHGREPASIPIDLFNETIGGPDLPGDSDQELLDQLETALAQLLPADREILRLAYFEALPHKTLAAQLNTTPKAVESRLARIRQKLRQSILQKLTAYALF